jgi:DNA polymerase III subunit beta
MPWVRLSSSRVTVAPDEWLAHPLRDQVTDADLRLASAAFGRALEQAAYAVPEDESRYQLAGVHLVGNDAAPLRLEATDGHRAAVAYCPVLDGAWVGEAIVPKAALCMIRLALPAADELDCTVTPAMAVLRVGAVTVGTRLIDGRFPNVMAHIPIDHPWAVALDVEALSAAVTHVLLLAGDRGHFRAIRLHFTPEGPLLVAAAHDEHGEAEAALAVTWPGTDPFTIAVHGPYLLQYLRTCAAVTVHLSLNDADTPLLLQTGDTPIGVISPIRMAL